MNLIMDENIAEEASRKSRASPVKVVAVQDNKSDEILLDEIAMHLNQFPVFYACPRKLSTKEFDYPGSLEKDLELVKYAIQSTNHCTDHFVLGHCA
jgi:hypothetical protein